MCEGFRAVPCDDRGNRPFRPVPYSQAQVQESDEDPEEPQASQEEFGLYPDV